MDTAFKINSMTLSFDESLLLLGNESGELLVIDPYTLSEISRIQGHAGAIYVVASHPRYPLAASLGMDRNVCLWDIAQPDMPILKGRFNLRRVNPWNDIEQIPVNPSQSQALCFHPSSPRIATRSANAGVVELSYSDSSIDLIHCTRLHGQEDVTTVRYPWSDSHHLLSGAYGSVVLSQQGLAVQTWKIAKNNVHWFEPLGDDLYLVANDDRRIVLFDLKQRRVVLEGPIFTRDDLEHVHYNSSSKRAFVVGFDRNVYEIDLRTCEPLGVVYKAPFKMRWFKTLRHQPDVAFIQCFDGGLYKVDISKGSCQIARRETPPALWTGCCFAHDQIVLTGEGSQLIFLHQYQVDESRIPLFEIIQASDKGEDYSYTKRMVRGINGVLWLGQTSGSLIRYDGSKSIKIRDFESAIRDLCITSDGYRVLVCLENGEAHSVDCESGKSMAVCNSKNDQPLWAMALKPDDEVLAVAERGGEIMFLDPYSLQVIKKGPRASRVKRMKWFDDNTLFFNESDSLVCYCWKDDTLIEFVEACGNTIEDFDWNIEFKYLVLIGYSTDIVLCDLETGEKLYTGADQTDYSKGVLFLPHPNPSAYPLDFITFGRSGTAHLFRIHNDKCVSLGPVLSELISDRYSLGNNVQYLS